MLIYLLIWFASIYVRFIFGFKGRQNQRLGNNKTVGGQQQQQQIKPVNRENQENRNADRSPRGNKFYENSNDDLAIR